VAHDAAWCAARIDRAAKTVTSAGVETPCDQLVIATGSAPFIFPVPGKDLPGVVTSRDLKDTNATIAAAKPGARAVVIGGGDAGTWLRSVGGCASCGPALNYYLRADWPTEYRDDRQSRFVNERNHANV
jgi:nitrite reductase (NADH) large subunit